MMTITNQEFTTIVWAAQDLVGSRLQDFSEVGKRFYINFWRSDHKDNIWVLDLSLSNPIFLPLVGNQNPPKGKSKSPTGLFLNAHFKGKFLKQVLWEPNFGRIITLIFDEDHKAELRLFRGGANLMLQAGSKKISFAKPTPKKELQWAEDKLAVRSLDQLSVLFTSLSSGQSPQGESLSNSAAKDPEALRKKLLTKIEKAIEKTKEDIEEKKTKNWTELAMWLQVESSLEVPKKWQNMLDLNLDLRANINRSFAKAKEIKEKIERSNLRLLKLQKEHQQIKTKPASELALEKSKLKLPNKIKKSQFKGRLLSLPSGHQLLIGRNARENLEALRAGGPWDYWLHLRDYPSSHAVLKRNKNEKLSSEILGQAFHHLIFENFRAKAASKVGEKYDILVAELRYVRPIKGDKLGRVHYSQESVHQHVFKLTE